jgi:hypothetical protein
MGTMFNALLKTAELLKYSRRGLATSGTTTTLVDSNFVDEPDDYFNDGTLFLLSGDNASESRKITDFVGSTGTFTVSAFDNAIVADVEYSAMRGIYPRETLVMGVNMALADLGPIAHYNILTPSDTDQESYALSGVYDIRRVEYTSKSAEPYDWLSHRHWREANNRLVFDTNHVPYFTKLRVWYMKPHGYVDADDDTISDYIHPMRLAWSASYFILLARMQRAEFDEPFTADMLQMAQAMNTRMTRQHPIPRLSKPIRRARW